MLLALSANCAGTQEVCWDVDENSDRITYDPRVSDTDGDGMPDGYEGVATAC